MSGTGVPGPPEPAGTFSISEKNSMLGITHSATCAPSGQVSRGRRTMGEYGNGPYCEGFMRASTRLLHGHAVEMRDHLVNMQHVRVFVMHVEQIDLVRELAAIEAALFHQHDV